MIRRALPLVTALTTLLGVVTGTSAQPLSSAQPDAAPTTAAQPPPAARSTPTQPAPTLLDDGDPSELYRVPEPSAPGQSRVITLEEAYRLGREHPALKAAREGTVQTDLLEDRVWTFWKPQLSATGTYTHYSSAMSMMFPDFTTLRIDPTNTEMPLTMDVNEIELQKQNSFGAIVQFQWPLFVGSLLVELANAREMQTVTRLQIRHQERSFLLAPVAATYYAAVAAWESVEVAQRSLETARKHHEATLKLFEVGQANRLAVLQAEIAAVNAGTQLRKAETAWRTALRNLEILLHVEGPLHVEHPALAQLPAGSESELLRRALERRPDFRATEILVEAARRSEDKALWAHAPTLAVTGNYRLSDSENFAGETTSWQVGLALTFPLYDGGARYVDAKESRSKTRQAILQRHALQTQIASEINQRLQTVQESETNLEAMRYALQLAREGVTAAQATFSAGMATNLDVLDANQALFEAEQSLVQLQIALDLARLQLAHAVGVFAPLEPKQSRGPSSSGAGR